MLNENEIVMYTTLIRADGTLENVPLDFGNNRCLISASDHGGFSFGCDLVSNDDLVGAVSDTGIPDGLPHNLIASLVFGQTLYGDCYVFESGDDDLKPCNMVRFENIVKRMARKGLRAHTPPKKCST